MHIVILRFPIEEWVYTFFSYVKDLHFIILDLNNLYLCIFDQKIFHDNLFEYKNTLDTLFYLISCTSKSVSYFSPIPVVN